MERTWGLTAFQLKVLALGIMTIDHVGAYCLDLPWVAPYEIPLRIVGRIAMPIFLFLFVQSLRYTHSRRRLMVRLYLAGLVVELWDLARVFFLGGVMGYTDTGNIFSTFLYIAVLVELLEQLGRLVRTRDRRTALRVLVLLALVLVPVWVNALAAQWLWAPARDWGIRYWFLVQGLTDALVPSLLQVEYTPIFLGLGVLLYAARTKGRQCAVFGLFCLASLGALFYGYTHPAFWTLRYTTVVFNDIQCWMFLALPLMLLYNGRRGRPVKWFFYWYYPLHRTILIAANWLLA